jgi:Kef-type K+ transport system membrane component KefB
MIYILEGVSALPVLARILAERHMLESNLGTVAMATTAIGTFYDMMMNDDSDELSHYR